MDLTALSEQFAIPGALSFDQTETGLVYLRIGTPAATATVYLHGAHLALWQPTGEQPVLYMSEKTELEPGKAIRGGVPIAFPWFAVDRKQDRIHGKPGPSHGFARIQDWELTFAALAGDDLHLTLALGPTEMSRELGFDHFQLAFQLTIGRELTMQLTVANDGNEPLVFEEALHTYFAVGDVRRTTVTGLEPTPYIDKTENSAQMPAAGEPLHFTKFTDRVYNHTTAACTIHDAAWDRRIVVEKENSETTVVFNPWKAMADLGEEEWPRFVCVETVNAVESPVTVIPCATHTMRARVRVEKGA